MPTIWNEDQVTLPHLVEHFGDSGLTRMSADAASIRLYTVSGFCHAVRLDEDRKFLRVGTTFPTDRLRSRAEKLELIQRYNSTLFLCSFSLDDEDDLVIDYVMVYENGLIIGQLMLLLKRFGSMIEHIVDEMNEDNLIRFDQDTTSDADESASLQLDESCPKDVLLN